MWYLNSLIEDRKDTFLTMIFANFLRKNAETWIESTTIWPSRGRKKAKKLKIGYNSISKTVKLETLRIWASEFKIEDFLKRFSKMFRS